MALRVIFLGNSDSTFSNRHFQALLQANCEVAGVVDAPPALRKSTNPVNGNDISFAAFARRQGIPLFEPARPSQPEFVGEIARLGPDVLLAIGYTQILKSALLSLPRRLAANFHASLLPAYRGMHPVFWCLRNGERWSGLTVHVMDSGVDTGDILYQVRVPTRKADSVASLYARIMDRSLPLVLCLADDISAGRLRRRPQPDIGASYYSALKDEDFRLDWRWDAAKIMRWIAISPGQCFVDVPCINTASTKAAGMAPSSEKESAAAFAGEAGPSPAEFASSRLFFLDARPFSATRSLPPGDIQSLDRRGAIVSTGKGSLRLERVRLADGKSLAIADACRLLGLRPGDCLGDPAQCSTLTSGPPGFAGKLLS